MKKAFAVILTLCMLLSLCACGSSTGEGNNYTTTSDIDTDYDNSYYYDYLSEAEAEQIALEKLYLWLKLCFSDRYNISATRYSVGSITGSSSTGYTVCGKYYLYDKYGDLAKTGNFSVYVDSNGFVDFEDIELFAD